MKTAFPFAGAALLLVLTILGSCQNQAIAQGKSMTHATACESGVTAISRAIAPD